jgi:hypothetical protein
MLKDAAVDAIRSGIELRKKLVQDQEWVDRINYRVTSFPPWGVRPARITSPKPVEPRLEPAPVAVEDLEQEARRTAALGELRALLCSGELPIELVAEAEAADLEQALEGCRSVAGISSGREPTAVELARQRSWARHSPDELVELFGTPLLQEVINQGKAEAAAREKAERQERGVDLVLPISPALVDELMQLWDASADRKALAMVACAALEALRTWINRPPPPPPPDPQVSLLDYPLMTHPGAIFRQTLGR